MPNEGYFGSNQGRLLSIMRGGEKATQEVE